ncbi:m40l [Myxoma virus]|uniref:Protein OPG079 n=2 Tax=Myxoma virus TaxID=10273 RepID=Q9Q8Q6_MYXVL|nr:DNA-binding phosphoprotein [Myxoma virus]ACB28834.1 m40L [recombinant virus 6918VP60-T2]AAF14928.1 m40L [Myxoma virus]ACB28663.1 m40L [Myxoma virus]ADK63680.1 m40L [Myxoma virus]AFU77472.1 m40L [Myxoma virus]
MRKAVVKHVVKKQQDGEEPAHATCGGTVEFLKTLSKSTEKCIDSVTLLPSQYPACSLINIKLVESLASRMTSTYILLEGEAKIYKNKKSDCRGDNAYFLMIKPTAASPMMYQLLECVYGNIRDGKRVPPSLCGINVAELEEKTLNKGCIFVNKLSGAVVEYKINGGKSKVRLIDEELESLAKRDKQISKTILVPIVFYRNSSTSKITFALKKLIIERDFSANVVDVDGKNEKISMVESTEEDLSRGLGVMELDDCIVEEEEEVESSLFNV